MGISGEQLCISYPQLYHMAEASSWPSISRHGLLSTTALLDMYEISGAQRILLESRHRPESVSINHPKYGSAVIRDQKPMRESALRKCLIGCSPRQWYELLNRKVFFWVIEERVNTLLTARAYRGSDHIVITLDTEGLMRKHQSRALLSPINSGSTIYRPVRRGVATFQSPDTYPYEERRKARGVQHAIAELAIDHSVPDLRSFTLKVERRSGERTLDVIYQR
jgi:hypothetical protein